MVFAGSNLKAWITYSCTAAAKNWAEAKATSEPASVTAISPPRRNVDPTPILILLLDKKLY